MLEIIRKAKRMEKGYPINKNNNQHLLDAIKKIKLK